MRCTTSDMLRRGHEGPRMRSLLAGDAGRRKGTHYLDAQRCSANIACGIINVVK